MSGNRPIIDQAIARSGPAQNISQARHLDHRAAARERGAVSLGILNAEPERFSDGFMAIADGTNWNPTGEGFGIFIWNGEWKNCLPDAPKFRSLTIHGGDDDATINLTQEGTTSQQWAINNIALTGRFTIEDVTNNIAGAFKIWPSSVNNLLALGKTATDQMDVGGNLLVSGNIAVTGTVDGRDVAADGTTLDNLNHDTLSGFVANEHIDWTNATQNFKTTGNVGVGVTALTELHVEGASDPEIRLRETGTHANTKLSFIAVANSNSRVIHQNGSTGLSVLDLEAYGGTGEDGNVLVNRNVDLDGGDSYFGVYRGDGGVTSTADHVLKGGSSGTLAVLCNNGGDGRVGGAWGIEDGISAPSTLSGTAWLYVDSADGDLKVKFGDGTVKTITVDT